jgi:hypothetical protein
MLRSRPMIEGRLRLLRTKLIEAFPDENRLRVLRSETWLGDPSGLRHELEHLLEPPPGEKRTETETGLIQEAIVALLRLDDSVFGAAALYRLATSGLKAKTGGKRRHQENKSSFKRRDDALLERANKMLTRNPHLSISKLAVQLRSKAIKAEFTANGLMPPPSARQIRRILARFKQQGLLQPRKN